MPTNLRVDIEPQSALALIEEDVTSVCVVSGQSGLPGILKRWLPILVKFASIQAVVQVLGFAAGILIVRTLPKREYALYTIGNTMLATILLLADSGISSALIAIGGRVWQDNHRLGSLLNTARQLRLYLAALTMLIVAPVLIWLLRQNGAKALTTAVLVLAVLVGSGLELITRIYATALRIRSEIRQIQNQALLAALVKLAVIGIAVFVFLNATIAIFAVVAGYTVQFWMLRRWASQEIDTDAPADPAMRSEIVAVIKKLGPHTIYYCLQGQIAIWLISIFGNAESVANVGALARLAMVFSVLASVTVEVVFPAFARIRSASQLRMRYFQIVLGYFAFSLPLVGVVAVFPRQVLSVLGSQYTNLQSEGLLMTASSVVGTMAGLLWGINCARAWVVPPQVLIPCTIILQAVLVSVLNLSTVRGVLLFSMYSAVPSILLSVSFAVKQMWGGHTISA